MSSNSISCRFLTGAIDGYTDEKTLFERQIQEKTDIIDRLEQELLCAGNRLQELEAEQQQIQEGGGRPS
jgi:A-kinase anchor protein 9